MTTALLLPGHMCDGRLWSGGGASIRTALERAGFIVDVADLTNRTDIGSAAAKLLQDHSGTLLPIGFSMGAIVAVELARTAPERVRGVVLAGYNATADLPERSAARLRQQDEVRAGGLERVLVEELKPNYLAADNKGDMALLSGLREMGLALGASAFLAQSEALRTRGSQVDVLPALQMPVLLLVGKEDVLCPPAWHRRWASLAPDASMEVIAGAGHMLPLEQPHAMASAITTWLQQKDLR